MKRIGLFCKQNINRKVISVAVKKKKFDQPNRRSGFPRRSYTYAYYIPERRNSDDRRDMENDNPGLADQLPPESDEKPLPDNAHLGNDNVRTTDD